MRSFRLLLPLLSLYASPIAQSTSTVSVRRPRKQPTLRIAHLLALVGIFLSALSFLAASSAFAQSTGSPSQSLNTRLKPAPNTTGTVTVNMTGQFATTPSDSFTLYKKIYTGTTNCNCPSPPFCPETGGGAVTYVSNISPTTTDSTALATTDSLLLQAFPGSNRNGQSPGYSPYPYPDAGVTMTSEPGYATCVAISDALTHNIRVSYTPGAQVLDATCTNPKFLFKPGETVCVRVVGTTATAGTPWHLAIYGGSNNACYSFPSLPAYPGTAITAETQTVTYTLPASNSDIPAACGPGGGSSGTTDIRGNWQVQLRDYPSNTYRAGDNFRIHDSNPSYDLQIPYVSVTDKNGVSFYSSWPTTGFVKYSISVQNGGPDAAPNPTLVASIPASTTYVSMTQTGGPPFTCGAPSGGNVTCTRASLAPDIYSSFELLVSYSGLAAGTKFSNTQTVNGSSGTDFYLPNNTYGPSPGPGLPPQTEITIQSGTNSGQFICPADITTPSTSASGATVTFPSFTTTASYTGGSTFYGQASGTVFPIGTTLVGWNSYNGSGGCSFKVNVTDGQNSDVTATKSHVGFFSRGQKGAQYSIVVKNTGGLATSGTVTVQDPLRQNIDDSSSNAVPGLMPTSMSGSGWNCNLGTISCSRSDALASGASYPPITFTVNVARTGVYNSLKNRAYVSGGGQVFTGNDRAEDYTGVISPLAAATPGDFNGDSTNDIVLRNYATGQDALWLMNGTTLMSIVDLPALPNANYRFEGTADFNGDGSNDIVLRNQLTGQDALWLMNGTSLSMIVDLPALANANYHFQGTGDFNHDGYPDIILRNFVTGQDALWLMNGTSLSMIVDLPALPNTNYQFAGAADFNGDGNVDIVLRNYATGQNALWLMNGTSLMTIVDLPALPNTNYRIDAVGDFNGDGQPDIVLRNYVTGQNAVWIMNGTSLSIIVDLPALPNTNYQIAGPR